MDGTTSCQLLDSHCGLLVAENFTYLEKENLPVHDIVLMDKPKSFWCSPNQFSEIKSPEVLTTTDGVITRDEYHRPRDQSIIVLFQNSIQEIVQPRPPPFADGADGHPSISKYVESELTLENLKHSEASLPKYRNLEPSLAMDWLEISWDELHIKERVGVLLGLYIELNGMDPFWCP